MMRRQLDLPGCIGTLEPTNTWWKIQRVGGTHSGYLEIRFQLLLQSIVEFEYAQGSKPITANFTCKMEFDLS